ncbi:hypothetical protein BGC_30260 [Burkholderia sp. 3C]
MRDMCSRTSAWKRSITRSRVPSGVCFQVANAACAASMAASISPAVANGTRASTCWVAGLTMSRHSVLVDSTNSPLINSGTFGTPATLS